MGLRGISCSNNPFHIRHVAAETGVLLHCAALELSYGNASDAAKLLEMRRTTPYTRMENNKDTGLPGLPWGDGNNVSGAFWA